MATSRIHLSFEAMASARAAPTEPPSAPPTDAELRERLRDLLAVQRDANAASSRATAATERARRRLADLQATLAQLAGIDAAITDATAAGLREGDDVVIPAALLDQRKARDLARGDRAAAEAALQMLTAN